MEKEIKFENARELKEQHPATFYAPDKKELDRIAPGDFVRVCTDDERFWVEVVAVENGIITGRVDNDLITRRLKYNDIISFRPDNVFNISPAIERKHSNQVLQGKANKKNKPPHRL